MFCLIYYPNVDEKFYEDVDEIKIVYMLLKEKEEEATLYLKHIVEKFKDKTVIIELYHLLTDTELPIFSALSNTYKNIKLSIGFYHKELYEQIKESGIPFFFYDAVTTFDTLKGFAEYHPTDIYICEELGFYLDRISYFLHPLNIKIRVTPNVCQSSFPETPSIKTFFIRPDDIKAYSKYVDIFELVADPERIFTIYKIYKQGKWIGNISDIIPTFEDNVSNSMLSYVSDSFGEIRASCKKRCSYSHYDCKICDRFIDLSKTMAEAQHNP